MSKPQMCRLMLWMLQETQARLRRRFHHLVAEFLAQTSSTVLTRIDFHNYTVCTLPES